MQRTSYAPLATGKEHSHTRRNTRAPEPVSQNEGSAYAFNPIMNSSASSQSTARLAGEDADLRQLEARLAMEGAARERLRCELDIRNCALDAATTHFIIGDTTKHNWPVVY